MKRALLISCSVFLAASAAIGCKSTGAPTNSNTISTPTPAPAAPVVKVNWSLTEPKVNIMDGTSIQFINSNDPIYFHLCFQSKGSCSVPIDIQTPKGCYIENNVQGWSTRRSVRIKWDDEKAQAQQWSIDDSHTALIPPNSTAFINELKMHKKFSIQLGCASYDSAVMTLDIAGLPEAMATLSVKH